MYNIDTIFEKVDCNNPDDNIINSACSIIKRGGLVAFPTETVYGLGADAFNVEAIRKIYEAKGRPSDNPLILHISSINEIKTIVKEITPLAYNLMEAFWPGPITMVFKKADIVSLCVTGGLDTVAIRFPSNNIARKLISNANTPIAAPSANSSGKPSPTRASHVKFDLFGKIDMIIDGGASTVGLESTVVDVTGNIPIILRPGAITSEMIKGITGCVDFDKVIFQKPDDTVKPKAPGMKYKHYSPKAEIVIVEGKQDIVVDSINKFVLTSIKQGKKVGIMATKQTKDFYKDKSIVFVVGDRDYPQTIAANLFKTLRDFDFLNIDIVYAESFSHNNMEAAIMNRLEKAAGYNIINV